MYTTILLDWDDTIWDFQTNAKLALSNTYEKENLSNYFENFAQFYEIYINKNHELWEQYAQNLITKDFLSVERFLFPLRQMGCNDEVLATRLSSLFLNLTLEQNTLIHGAKDVVEKLSHDFKLVIISNGFNEVQYKKINDSGIAHFFSDIVLSDEVGVQKPDKRFFDFTLEKLGVNKAECLVVGDNYETDICGAINSQIDAVYFNPNNRRFVNNPLIKGSILSLNDIFTIVYR